LIISVELEALQWVLTQIGGLKQIAWFTKGFTKAKPI